MRFIKSDTYQSLTFKSIISLFFFSISCLAASSDAPSDAFDASSAFVSDLAASVDCHLLEIYCDIRGCDERAACEEKVEDIDEEICRCCVNENCLVFCDANRLALNNDVRNMSKCMCILSRW